MMSFIWKPKHIIKDILPTFSHYFAGKPWQFISSENEIFFDEWEAYNLK